MQWSTSDEETVVSPELHQRAVEEGVVILQSVSLVNNQRRPSKASKKLFVFQKNFIRGEEGVELQLVVEMAYFMFPNLRKVQKGKSYKRQH